MPEPDDLEPLVRRAMEIEAEYARRDPGMNHTRFAIDVLRITPEYWAQLRGGKRTGRGGLFVRNFLARFPNEALSMRSDLPVVKDSRQVPSAA